MTDATDFLEHHGVKGMKWGVINNFKKNYHETRDTPTETVTVKTRDGKEVTLIEDRKFASAAVIGAIAGARYRQAMKDSRSFTLHADGQRVGEASFNHQSKEELNLVWLGVAPSQRGKGYATAVFDSGVQYAKSKGYSKITLEVPGNAPDARHIYEKFGFKVDQAKTDSMNKEGEEDVVWGGLTAMEYKIKK